MGTAAGAASCWPACHLLPPPVRPAGLRPSSLRCDGHKTMLTSASGGKAAPTSVNASDGLGGISKIVQLGLRHTPSGCSALFAGGCGPAGLHHGIRAGEPRLQPATHNFHFEAACTMRLQRGGGRVPPAGLARCPQRQLAPCRHRSRQHASHACRAVHEVHALLAVTTGGHVCAEHELAAAGAAGRRQVRSSCH